MCRQTNKSVYIVVQAIVNNQLNISAERTIHLTAIKSVNTSTLKDDWFSIVVGAPQEPDPLLSCIFKTEFFTHLNSAVHGQLNLKIAEG
jgi:myosin I